MQQEEKNDNKKQVSKIYFMFVSQFFFVAQESRNLTSSCSKKIAKSSKIKGFNVYFFLLVPVSESNIRTRLILI